MKRLKKGFTLIELLVVIAIIGILATTLAPKLREQLAKAKDAKAIALLGAARTIGGTILINKMVQGTTENIALEEIKAQLDKKANAMFSNTTDIIIGGSKTSATVGQKYGGAVKLGVIAATSGATISAFADDSTAIAISEDTEIALTAATTTTGAFSTEGKAWVKY